MAIKLKLVILIFLIPMTCVFSQSGLGTIKGTVKDEVSKQPLPYSKIFLLQNGATLMEIFKLMVFLLVLMMLR